MNDFCDSWDKSQKNDLPRLSLVSDYAMYGYVDNSDDASAIILPSRVIVKTIEKAGTIK